MPNSPLQQRIQSLHQLGEFLKSVLTPSHPYSQALLPILDQAMAENRWFTHDSMRQALGYWSEHLNKETLNNWLSAYKIQKSSPKRVLLILAGNLPLVGFHDLLCTYLSGHMSVVKASQKDRVLLRFMLDQLLIIDPTSGLKVEWTTTTTTNFDAVIATGSTNSSRYFDYYFNKYPHVIRRNRNSVAYLGLSTSSSQLTLLCRDVFDYFGLGCRNVTHLLLQRGFELHRLIEIFKNQIDLQAHNKYMNNVDYHRSVFMMNQQPFIEASSVLMVENESIHSPIGVLHYQWVDDQGTAENWIHLHQSEIQCVVNGADSKLSFGAAQQPALSEYADQIDTLDFLLAL